MSNKIKFYLDENMPKAVATELRRLGIDVTTTPDKALIGRVDMDQQAFANQEERVLVTRDDDFLKIASQHFEHFGIVYFRQHRYDLGTMIKALKALYDESPSHDALKGQIKYPKAQ